MYWKIAPCSLRSELKCCMFFSEFTLRGFVSPANLLFANPYIQGSCSATFADMRFLGSNASIFVIRSFAFCETLSHSGEGKVNLPCLIL